MSTLPLAVKILLVLACIVLVFYVVNKITVFLRELFKPFKKGQKYWCRVRAVSDGDTLTCYRFNMRRSETKLRFAFIDAPESNQPFGKESQKIVSQMVQNKLVRVRITDVDRYGRCVGVIYRGRKNVNEELVRQGAAWVYEEYIRDKNQLQHLVKLQDTAKKNKKGLWKASRPIRPSVFRKQKTA